MEDMKIFILLSIFVTTHQFFVLSTGNESINYRLPNDSIPHHYKIKFIPHIVNNNFTFDGMVEISLQVLKSTNKLTLHSSDLKICEKTTILIGEKGKIVPDLYVFDTKRDFLSLQFPNDLQPGNYTLHLKYSSEINGLYTGLYRSHYLNDKNQKVYYITTFFQPTAARKAFPCWDEPALKATFDISVRHFANYTALSNMPSKKITNEIETDGKIWTDFETSPLMSTYLVSIFVSDFGNITNDYGNYSVWSRKNVLDSIIFTYKTGLEILPFLEEYTNISYPFPKLDNIAVLHIPTGGIENWGLIGYREHQVVHDKNSKTKDKLHTMLLVTHEIAHQWFGSLVTPAWWKHIWLSEGIAQYMESLITAKIMNDTRIMDLFVVKNYNNAFRADSVSSVISLSPEVSSPHEIGSVFMSITYSKGASITHMLSNLLSEEVFQTGIRNYLERHKFKTVTSDDLWKSLQGALNESKLPQSNIEIKKVMDPYIQQRGYPVINVIRNYKTGLAKLTQECLVCSKIKIASENDNIKWWIPINFATNSSFNFSSSLATHWMNPKDEELIIEGLKPDDWIIINKRFAGYYRVNYDEMNWKKIANYLNSDKFSNIHVLNRVQILEDAFWLFKEEKLDLDILLDLTSYLVRETDYLPWISGFQILDYFMMHFRGTSIHPSFERYVLWLLDALINDVTLEEKEDDDLFILLNRAEALKWACDVGHVQCRKKAKNYLLDYIKNPNSNLIPPNFKDWILCTGMEESDESIWNSLLNIYNKTKSEQTLQNLSCVKTRKLLTKYLQLIVKNDSVVPNHQFLDLISFANAKDPELTFDFIIANLGKIGNNSLKLNVIYYMIIEQIIYPAARKEILDKMKDYLKENPYLVNSDLKYLLLQRESELAWFEKLLKSSEKVFAKFVISNEPNLTLN